MNTVRIEGSLSVKDLIVLNEDGSATFANTQAFVDADGRYGNNAGFVNADGSVSFAAEAFKVESDGTPVVNSQSGLTVDLEVVDSVGTPRVLHFEKGILTSVA